MHVAELREALESAPEGLVETIADEYLQDGYGGKLERELARNAAKLGELHLRELKAILTPF